MEQLGESRETWCAVELDKAQAWCRTKRKHFQVMMFSVLRRLESDLSSLF